MSESAASQMFRGVAYDHAYDRHDEARKERSFVDRDAETIASYEAQLALEDWQLGCHPARTRAYYRTQIEKLRAYATAVALDHS